MTLASKADVNLAVTISTMIAGAEKAGTSALVAHLAQVPEVRIPMTSGSRHDFEFASEFSYFLSDSPQANEDIDPILRASLAEDFDAEAHIVVAKNVGLGTDRAAMQKLRDHSPNVKIIFLLREPVSRAISSHAYQIFRGGEQETDFGAAARQCLCDLRAHDRHTDYLRRGLYSGQISDLIDVFGHEKCLFLLFEDIVSKSSDTIEKVGAFVGVKHLGAAAVERVNAAKEPRSRVLAGLLYRDSFPKRLLRQCLPLSLRVRLASALRRLNARARGAEKPEITPEFRDQLRDYFRDDLKRCERLTALDLIDRWGF